MTVQFHGLREVDAALKELPRRMERNLLNKGLIAGARVVRDEARARVPLLKVPNPRRVRGALRRAIHAGAVRPDRYAATVWVRVRGLTRRQTATFKRKTGKAAAENPLDPFYWRFVEFGTSKMPARPFMRMAFESKKRQAVETAIATLRPLVDAEIAKLGRRFI